MKFYKNHFGTIEKPSILSFPSLLKWESATTILSFPSLRKRGKRESNISIDNINSYFFKNDGLDDFFRDLRISDLILKGFKMDSQSSWE